MSALVRAQLYAAEVLAGWAVFQMGLKVIMIAITEGKEER
jgi:hypothetical protein